MLKNLWNKSQPFIFPLSLVLGLGLRVYASLRVPAQFYDIATYEAWGKLILDKGPADFFATTWSDYLPLPIYFCALIYQLAAAINIDYQIVFKLTVSLIELGLIALIGSLLKNHARLLLIPLLILSPAVIGDSAFWGQLDTIPSLLTVLALVVFTSKSNLVIQSAVLFGLAVAFKPIMLLVVPIFILTLFKSRQPLIRLLYFAFVSFTTFIVPAYFVSDSPLRFVYQKSVEQASTYPYTTINAWNLWSVADLHNQWPPDNATIFGLSAHTLGLILFGVFAIRILYLWYTHAWEQKYAARVAGSLLVGFFVLTTRMHERHLFFGIPFLALACLGDKLLSIPTTILTVTFTLNLWAAYWWVNHHQTWPVSPFFISTVSWVNVMTTLYLALGFNLKSMFTKLGLWLGRNKYLALIILLAIFLRTYQLGYPQEYIFDEVYHSFTSREYIHNHIEAWEWWTTPPPGVAYEWTHPPVAKYGMVLGMLLFGEHSFGWRIGSAVMGVISILGLYNLVQVITSNKTIALLTAFLVSIEGLHLSQSRVGMNDTYMLAFLVWSLYMAAKSRFKPAAILYGLALGSKWSALYGVVPLAVIYLYVSPIKLTLNSLIHHSFFILRLLLISVITYILTFTPFLVAGHTWAQWWELHRQMWYYHTHLVATHAYESTPKEWIFSLRPVWYYVHYGESVSNIYAQGNPLVLWLGLVSLIMLIPRLLTYPNLILFVSYGVFVIPWLFSPRIMFFYHYLPSATFLCALLATWLYELPKKLIFTLLAFFVLTLILMSPVYFGFPMEKAYWDTMFTIFPSWK